MHKHLRLTCYALLCLLVPIGVMAQTEHTYFRPCPTRVMV